MLFPAPGSDRRPAAQVLQEDDIQLLDRAQTGRVSDECPGAINERGGELNRLRRSEPVADFEIDRLLW